jgi:signal transduction histidine kinase
VFTAPTDERRLEPDLETACFRVVQEAVTNVIRHSRASRLTVSLRYQGTALLLSVRDNGRGFNVADTRRGPARAALGLLGMEERVALAGGELKVHSIVRRGTTVKVRFPLRWRSPQIAADTI